MVGKWVRNMLNLYREMRASSHELRQAVATHNAVRAELDQLARDAFGLIDKQKESGTWTRDEPYSSG